MFVALATVVGSCTLYQLNYQRVLGPQLFTGESGSFYINNTVNSTRSLATHYVGCTQKRSWATTKANSRREPAQEASVRPGAIP